MLVTLIAGAFSLGVLILVHELGHLIAAKLAGIRVLRFSLGLGRKVFGLKLGETEWVLSVIPFGGYVKLAGMEPREAEGREWEFGSKRLWVRAAVFSAGPLFNFLLGVVILCLVLWAMGVEVVRTTEVGRVEPGSPAFQAGIEKRDKILSVDGHGVRTWSEVVQSILNSAGKPVTLRIFRGGDERELRLKPESEGGALVIGLEPWLPPVVGGVKRGSPARALGLKSGDRIVAVEGKEMEQWYDLVEMVSSKPGDSLRVVWRRGEEVLKGTVVPQIATTYSQAGEPTKVGRLGILREIEREKFGLARSLKEGFLRSTYFTVDVVMLLVKMIRGQVSPRALGGPVTIFVLAGESASWGIGWLFSLIAFLSINLFVLNLVPLPPLDGGNLVLLSIEGIRGGSISERQRLIVQQVGIALLFFLVMYVLFNDVVRFWGERFRFWKG